MVREKIKEKAYKERERNKSMAGGGIQTRIKRDNKST